MDIRLIEKKDLNALADIFAKVYEVFDVGERWTKETAQKLLEHWLQRQPDLAFLAEVDGKIVGGFTSGIKPWWDGNHLFDGELFVHPDYQKHKVGTALFKKLLTEAKEKYEAKFFDAHTFKGFDHPLNWYKKLGFEEIKEWVMISGDVTEILGKLG